MICGLSHIRGRRESKVSLEEPGTIFDIAYEKQQRVCDICIMGWLFSGQVVYRSLFLFYKRERLSIVFTLSL
jgi:hypothetical protein